MKYPITPEYLAHVPDKLVRIYMALEDSLIEYICEQFTTQGEANETSLEYIRFLQRRGLSLREIEKRVKEATGLAEEELDEIYAGAIRRNKAFFQDILTKMKLLFSPKRKESLQAEIDAISRQTHGELQNITQSMGFALRGPDGKVTVTPIMEAYQKILDEASVQVWSGAVDLNTAVRNAVKKLCESGIQYVDYDSGWHNRVDVAARRAVMTGISQLSARYTEAMMEELGTDCVEVTAHRGARDKGTGPANHKSWQGKVYRMASMSGKAQVSGNYPDLVEVTGYGTGEGLNGWNCRHKMYPFVPEIMEPTYTEEQLQNIDPPPFTFEGKEYTAYEATQKQRQIETAMRQCQRDMIGFTAAGQTDEATAAGAKYQRLKEKYKEFSKAADLPLQMERGYDKTWGPEAEKLSIQMAKQTK